MTEVSAAQSMAATGARNETPTIVSGLPRSGTSMMMQILEAGGLPVLTDNVRQADEDNPKGYYEFEPVKRVKDDPSWLDEAPGKVVKMVYRLLYDLPSDRNYRVVFMKRRLAEVIASQDEMLKRHGQRTDDMDKARLADVYEKQLAEAQNWLAQQPNFSVLYVDYRDVLDDTDRVVDELNDFLGGTLNTDAMRAVPDRTLYRNRT